MFINTGQFAQRLFLWRFIEFALSKRMAISQSTYAIRMWITSQIPNVSRMSIIIHYEKTGNVCVEFCRTSQSAGRRMFLFIDTRPRYSCCCVLLLFIACINNRAYTLVMYISRYTCKMQTAANPSFTFEGFSLMSQ